MAPLTPFLADEMYRNLVASQDASAPESVHLAEFPTADKNAIEQRLIDAARLAMRIASLGRAARASAQIRVRQPLPRVLVAVRLPEEESLLPLIEEQVLEELNVKALIAARGGDIPAGFKRVEEDGYIVAMDTAVTPELVEEGIAREVVRRIQNLRRAASFELTDRIVTYYTGSDKIRGVMERFADYIRQETLSGELRLGEPDAGAFREEKTRALDGEKLAIAVKKL
jgi:isoleucyl-tRNA synthetase